MEQPKISLWDSPSYFADQWLESRTPLHSPSPQACHDDLAKAGRSWSLAHDTHHSQEPATSPAACSSPCGRLMVPATCEEDEDDGAFERHLLKLEKAIFSDEGMPKFPLHGLDAESTGCDSVCSSGEIHNVTVTVDGRAERTENPTLTEPSLQFATTAHDCNFQSCSPPGHAPIPSTLTSSLLLCDPCMSPEQVAAGCWQQPAATTTEVLSWDEGWAHGDVAPRQAGDESSANEFLAPPPVRGTLMTPLASRLAAVLKRLEHPSRGGSRADPSPAHIDESAAAAESARGGSTAGRVGAAKMPSGSSLQPGRQELNGLDGSNGGNPSKAMNLPRMDSDTMVVSEPRIPGPHPPPWAGKEAESAESAAESAAASAPSSKTQVHQDVCNADVCADCLRGADGMSTFCTLASQGAPETGDGSKKQRRADAQGAAPHQQSGAAHEQLGVHRCRVQPAVGACDVRKQKAVAAARSPAGASLVPVVAPGVSNSWHLEQLAPRVRVERPVPQDSAWGQDQSRFTDPWFQKRVMSRLLTLATAYSTCQQEVAQKHLLWLRQLATPHGAAIQRLVHYMVSGLLVRFEGAGAAASPGFSADHELEGALINTNTCIRRLWGSFPEILITQSFIPVLQGKTSIHIILLTQSIFPDWQELFNKIGLGSPAQPKVRVSIVVPCTVALGPPETQNLYLHLGESLMAAARTAGVHATWSLSFMVPSEFNPSVVQVAPGETVAVAAWLSMQMLPDESVLRHNPRQQCLQWIKSLAPAVVTIVDRDMDYNNPFFLSRFRGVLRFAKAVLDNLEHTIYCHSTRESRAADLCLEAFFALDLQNCVACDGLARIPRSEPLSKWRDRLQALGLRERPLGAGMFEALRAAPQRHRRLWVEDVGGFASLRWDGTPILFGGVWC